MPEFITPPYPWPDMISRLHIREGIDQYTNHPLDRGGPTKFGVTLATLRRARNDNTLTAKDVRDLQQPEAISIAYRFFTPPFTNATVPLNILEILFDTTYLFGPRNAVEILQRTLNQMGFNLKVDEVYGKKTEQALYQADYVKLAYQILLERTSYHIERVLADPTQLVFLKGWHNRNIGLSKLL